MNFRQLRYFVGVVEAGSLSPAAAQLNVAQSAISQQLTNLETELRAQLLVRHPTGVTETDAGRSLYRHACSILRQLELAKDDAIMAGATPAGPVSIGIPPVLSTILGFSLFSAVRSEYPEIKLSIVDEYSLRISDLLLDGGLDMALLFTADGGRKLDAERLLTEELFYMTTGPAQNAITLAEIAAQPLILAGRESSIRALVQKRLREEGIAIEPVGEIDSKETLMQAAASGMAGTILPWSATFGDETSKHLTLVPIADPAMRRPISLCFPKLQARRSTTDAVAAALRACITGLVKTGQWSGVALAGPLAKDG